MVGVTKTSRCLRIFLAAPAAPRWDLSSTSTEPGPRTTVWPSQTTALAQTWRSRKIGKGAVSGIKGVAPENCLAVSASDSEIGSALGRLVGGNFGAAGS